MKTRHAFTLIELLVVIAIIALLLSILLPGLKRAKDLAKRVVCASRLKQTGVGIKMYADAYDEFLPDDHDINGGRERHTYAVYRNNPGFVFLNGKLKPLRFAYLYELDYIDTPEIFYCPGNRLDAYKYESYTKPAPWGTLPQQFNTINSSNDWVRMGFTYYPVELNAKIDSISQAPVKLAIKHVRLNPGIPMATDIIHNRPTISHQNNNNYSLNALYSDVHVSNCNDKVVFETLMDPFGKNVWDELDRASFASMTYYDSAIYTIFRAIGP